MRTFALYFRVLWQCIMHTHLHRGLLYPWCVITLPMYNAHPYFSLKHLGKKKCVLYTAKYSTFYHEQIHLNAVTPSFLM